VTTEIKRLIQVRADKGAGFKRDGYGKKRQLSDSWRKPRGQHNKQREQKKAKGALPKPGFGSPVAVRGMHPSGFFEILLFTVKDLEGIDPKTHAIRIGASVGERTRLGLQEKALAAGFKVLNARTVKKEPEQEKAGKPAAVEEKKKKEEKKPAPSAAKAVAVTAKKDTKKGKKTPGAEEKKSSAEEKKSPAEEKKPPAKEKKPVKPKAEQVEKPVKETKEAVPVKTTKKPAKPKTESSNEAKPAAVPKSKAKKKTESEVKKDE
jgi:large subunit ribosomal protein L32e